MIKAGQTIVADPEGNWGFLIPVTWKVCDKVRVQANTLEEAHKYLKEHLDEIPLGEEPSYLDGSYEIGNLDECEEYLDEAVNYSKEVS